jgi:hypothetical protein
VEQLDHETSHVTIGDGEGDGWRSEMTAFFVAQRSASALPHMPYLAFTKPDVDSPLPDCLRPRPSRFFWIANPTSAILQSNGSGRERDGSDMAKN